MKPLAFACLLAAALPAADNPAVTGLNHFATGAYQGLATGNDNLIFSPFSISVALSMALAGASGQTAAGMEKVLHQVQPGAGYHTELAALVDRLEKAGNSGANALLTANGLWVQNGFPVLPDFQRTIQTLYRAPLTPLDFSANPEGARGEINSWTERQTRGKIHDLFGPGSLRAGTRLVLASAIYFNGKWQAPFRTASTHPAPFTLASGRTTQANFMNQSGTFGYAETAELQILEMQYAGTPLAFDIILPKAPAGLPAVEKSLSPEKLAAWFGGLENRKVEVAVPKFRAEAGFSLREMLARMGMGNAFSSSADFSGITGRRDLELSEVRHKAFVDVSEEGTEAAAATGISISRMAMRTPPPVVFRADHPFTFLIRDTTSGVILFAGRLATP